MKLKHILLGAMLFLLPYNLISQIDSVDFYDLKLKSDRVQVYEKRDGYPDKIKKLRLPETYFFFTENGIYGADAYGILKYEFTTSLSFTEQNQLNRFEIRAYDHDFKNNCKIVLFDYYNKGKYKIFFVYEKRQFIFDCDPVE
jgi:hypothetical protein